MKVKKIPLKEFTQFYSKVPRFCVDLLIIDKNKVLLTKRDIPPDQGWWHFPGGTVLIGESLKNTIQRVAKEELNTKVKIIKLISLLEYGYGSGLGYPISAVYSVKPVSKKVAGGKQAKEIGYFKILPENTLPEVKKFLKTNFRSL